ncbi:MAG: hypothetical protein AAGD13_14170 [Pseudomonadota bacterium]
MVEITNENQLRAWLEDRPRRDATVIAARSALRVVSLFTPLIEADETNYGANVILPCFRATAVAYVSGIFPARAKEVESSASAADEIATDVARHRQMIIS